MADSGKYDIQRYSEVSFSSPSSLWEKIRFDKHSFCFNITAHYTYLELNGKYSHCVRICSSLGNLVLPKGKTFLIIASTYWLSPFILTHAGRCWFTNWPKIRRTGRHRRQEGHSRCAGGRLNRELTNEACLGSATRRVVSTPPPDSQKFLKRPQLHSLTYPGQMVSTAPFFLKTANENGSGPEHSEQSIFQAGRSLPLPGASLLVNPRSHPPDDLF